MLFDPNALTSFWRQREMERISGTGSKASPSSVRRQWEGTFSAILRWVEEGNTLLVLVRELPPMESFLTRENKISENPNEWEPFARINLKRRSGNLVEPTPPYAEAFTSFQTTLSYQYVIAGSGLTPLYKTSSVHPHNRETVAGFLSQGRGVIVFAPQPNEWSPGYLDAIGRLPQKREHLINDLPDWVGRFQNDKERDALDRLAAAQRELEEAHQRIEREQEVLRDLRESKVLYAGADAALVEEAAKALREFGLRVVDGPHPRADLIIWDGTRLAAAEVKGLEASAREVDVRQVNTWSTEVNRALSEGPDGRATDPVLVQYAEKLIELGIDTSRPRTDIECHGLIIITTFRKTPLEDRTQESFPDPVAKLIGRSDVAALTGLDLYCLIEEVRINPSRKNEVAQELLTFRQVMAPRDWRQFITAAQHGPA